MNDEMQPAEELQRTAFALKDLVQYNSSSIVSRIILKRPSGNVTLFAFDRGQELSEHTTPFDALVQIVEGEAEVLIGGTAMAVHEGQSVIMPAHIPHGVKATERFKMLLTMIRS